MSSTKFDHKKTPLRFSCLVIIMMAVTLAMLGKALYMMTAERTHECLIAFFCCKVL